MRRPMFLCGVAVCICAAITFYFGVIAAVVSALVIFILSLFFKNCRQYAPVIIITLMLLSVSTVKTDERIKTLDKFSGETITLKLMAVESPKNQNGLYSLEVYSLQNGKFPKSSKLLLKYYDAMPIKAGDIFTAKVEVASYKNHINKAYYYSNGIYARLQMKSFNGVFDNNGFFSALQTVRDYIRSTLFSNMSYDSAVTMNAITVGDKSDFDEIYTEKVRHAGVSHVMVVSGMHLAIIINFIFKRLDRLFYNRYIRVLLAIAVVIFISGVCGFTVSTIRAGVMYVAAAFAIIMGRDGDSTNTLGFAVTAILILTPMTVLNLSFQLSVLATFAIVAVAPEFCRAIYIKYGVENKYLKAIISLFINTLSATIFTLPVTIYNFGLVSIVSPFTNLAVSYAVTIALTLTAVGILLSLIPYFSALAIPIFYVTDIVVKYVNTVINFFGTLPFASMQLGRSAVYVAIFFISLLVIFLYACKKRRYLV